MSNQINYKQKYMELKQKFMESVDTAFALGFEQGQVQAQQDQMMQQQQQALEAEQNAQQGFGEGHGAEGSPAGEEQQANPNGGDMPQEPDSQNPAGSELDQHIEKLESMVSKSEVQPAELMSFLQDLRKSAADAKQAAELKKSAVAIKGIAKALHKPAFKIGQQASHNMNSNAKAAVTMQHKIVNDIMKS
jgi:hypothetical protein